MANSKCSKKPNFLSLIFSFFVGWDGEGESPGRQGRKMAFSYSEVKSSHPSCMGSKASQDWGDSAEMVFLPWGEAPGVKPANHSLKPTASLEARLVQPRDHSHFTDK